MEKKIENYIHLYGLGLRVVFDNKIWEIQQLKQKTVRLIRRSEGMYTKWNECSYAQLKPILRRLPSMTEEECWEYQNLFKVFIEGTSDDYISNRIYVIREIVMEQRNFNGEKVLWALSKHFDLFGLIDAGLALSTTDKSK